MAKDNAGREYTTANGEPAETSGTQITTPTGETGTISGGLIWTTPAPPANEPTKTNENNEN